MIVNAFALVIALASLVAMLALEQARNEWSNNEDDQVAKIVDEITNTPMNSPWYIFAQLLKIVCATMGIWAGYDFDIVAAVVAGVAHLTEIGISMFSRNAFGMIFYFVCFYAHVAFLRELRAGIMTQDNYVNEKSSCCCV